MVVAGAGLVDAFIHSFAPSASMSPALAVMLGAQRMEAGVSGLPIRLNKIQVGCGPITK